MSAPRRAAGARQAGATALIGACAALLLVLAGSVAPSLAYVEAHSAASVNVLVGAAATEEEPDEQDAGASDEPTAGDGDATDATDDEAGADAGEEGGTDDGEAGSGDSGTDAGSDGGTASGGTEDAAATVFVDTGDATPLAALAAALAALAAAALARSAWTRRLKW